MKKIISLALILAFATLALALTSCGFQQKEGLISEYEFSRAETYDVAAADEFAFLDPSFNFVYSDTVLELYEDGSFRIMDGMMPIDLGTYTRDGAEYVFSGFDYGTSVYGRETASGFVIDFVAYGTKLATLFYVD